MVSLEKEEWRHVKTMVRTAYRGMVIRSHSKDGLLVRFDGSAEGAEDAECWVDEV